MALVTLKSVLDHSMEKGYAVGAFNFNGIEDARGIIEAAEEKNSPVILMASTSAVKYFGGAKPCAAFVAALAQASSAPIVLHVDHCTDLAMIKDCVDAGFSSVMIDASSLSFEENVAKTAAAVDYAKRYGVSVEGELGRLGGREENVDVSDRDANMTDPASVQEFVKRTGIDALAIAIGNAHGFYKGTPKLDFDRIVAIRALVDCGLVLHGGTGIPADMIKKAISLGVSKINVNTECQLAFAAATRKYVEAGKDLEGKGFDPRKLLAPGVEAIKATVREKIELFGSAGKA